MYTNAENGRRVVDLPCSTSETTTGGVSRWFFFFFGVIVRDAIIINGVGGSRRLQRNFKTQDLVNTSKQKPADFSWSSVAEIASRLPKSFVRRDALVSTAVRCVLFSLYLSLSDPYQ